MKYSVNGALARVGSRLGINGLAQNPENSSIYSTLRVPYLGISQWPTRSTFKYPFTLDKALLYLDATLRYILIKTRLDA